MFSFKIKSMIGENPVLKPPALRDGDTVGIVAPSSAVGRDEIEAGCRRLYELGYKPFYLPSIFENDLYFAGTVERRVGELHEMYARPEVRAVLCARGGYGCNYLLPHLDANLIRGNPKIFVGYSDATWLLGWLADLGQVVFHGPMAARGFAQPDGVHLDSWRAAVCGEPCSLEFGPESSVKPLVAGTASGVLCGGCLSIVSASLGTAYEPDTDGRILFLEDVSAKPYQIDRMLMQLRFAGKLDGVRGIIFGEMLDCVQPGGQPYSLQEIVARIVRGLGVPVAYGIPSGHVERDNVTLPFGVEVELSVTDSVQLHIDAATTHSSGHAQGQ
jgi:muramoyltetrapeptide carboxypeptidase